MLGRLLNLGWRKVAPLVKLAFPLLVVFGALIAMIPKPLDPISDFCNDLHAPAAPSGPLPNADTLATYLPGVRFVSSDGASSSDGLQTVVLPPPEKRPYDLVVFGATGFTGRLVARYLDTHPSTKGLKWAVAGRSEAKVASVLAELQSSEVGSLVANSSDPASMGRLVACTRVVLTTVGPYVKYGNLLVAAAAATGTHYADLSGEVFWMRDMIDQHHAAALASGAKVVTATGYDSVPFDLGTLALIDAFREAHGTPPTEVTAAVTKVRGFASGGTLASVKEIFTSIFRGEIPLGTVTDPYLLLPDMSPSGSSGSSGDSKLEKCRKDSEVSGWGFLPRWDPDTEVLGVQHFMAATNSRIVRRSLSYFGHRNCSYAEGMSFLAMVDATMWLGKMVLSGKMPMSALAPSPGEGPSPAMMREGLFHIRFVGTDKPPEFTMVSGDMKRSPESPAVDDGTPTPPVGRPDSTKRAQIELRFTGDPGYNATSKMIAEGALCLADPACHGPAPASGGILTPASAMGLGFFHRLLLADEGGFVSSTTSTWIGAAESPRDASIFDHFTGF